MSDDYAGVHTCHANCTKWYCLLRKENAKLRGELDTMTAKFDYVRDMIAKGRGRPFGDRNKNKTHCPRGHEYNEENTYQYRGRRQCKTCKRDSNRRM